MSDNNKQVPLHRWKSFTRKLPYGLVKTGYKVNPEDHLELIPDEEQIIFIEQAFNYLDAGSSLREVSEWLGQKLQKSVTHQTLSNLYKKHRRPFLGGQKTKKNTARRMSPEQREVHKKRMAAVMAERTAARKKQEFEATKNKLKAEDYDTPPVPKEKPPAASTTDTSNLPSLSPTISVAFRPNPGPQTEFLSSNIPEVLYGGAAGGEPKSWFSASFLSNESK